MRSIKKTGSITGKAERSAGNAQGSEFDRFAESYSAALNASIGFSGYESAFFDERKIRELHGFLKLRGLADSPFRFLNFGCGVGNSERYIRRYFPRAAVYSVDPSRESIEIARQNNSGLGDITFGVIDGNRIPFEHEFDVVLAANVFHHIPPGERVAVLKHIFQKTSERGYLFIFEHNPFNPLTRKVVNSCPFDENAVLLNPFYTNGILRRSGFTGRRMRFIHFFPKFLAFLTPLEKLLRKFPLGAQYYFIASKREKL
jgi:SAM-dependent methyltransferase